MLTKRILNSLMNLRSVSLSSCLKNVQCISQFSAVQDEYKTFLDKIHRADELTNEIDTAPPTILKQIKKNEKEMKGANIVRAVNTLSKQFKENEQNLSRKSYDDLYNLLESHINEINMTEVIEVLQSLMVMNVSTSSRIFGLILQRADFLLHTSNLNEYNKLARLLCKMAGTPKIGSLYNKMNKKFVIKITNRFEKDDIQFLDDALRYSCFNLKDKMMLQLLVDVLERYNFENVPVSNAISIMRSLTFLKIFPYEWKTVLKKTQDILIKNIDDVHLYDITGLLVRIVALIKNNRQYAFYNKDLIDSCVKTLISRDIGLTKDLYICLESLINLRHLNNNMLSYIAAKFYEEKYMMHKNIPNEVPLLSSLVCGLAYSSYKPVFWNEIYESLTASNIQYFSLEHLLIYSLHLACLDCYDIIALDRIFNSRINFFGNRYLHWTYLKLWQKLKTLPNYDGPMPPEKVIKNFKVLLNNHDYPLQSSLKLAMGGTEYVKSNVKSRLYHQIDHVIILRQGEYPVDMGTINMGVSLENQYNVEFIEDLKIPANCHLISLLHLPSSWYSVNTGQLLGIFKIYVETLETMSKVIPISKREWVNLSEKDKVDFLITKINAKVVDCNNIN